MRFVVETILVNPEAQKIIPAAQIDPSNTSNIPLGSRTFHVAPRHIAKPKKAIIKDNKFKLLMTVPSIK